MSRLCGIETIRLESFVMVSVIPNSETDVVHKVVRVKHERSIPLPISVSVVQGRESQAEWQACAPCLVRFSIGEALRTKKHRKEQALEMNGNKNHSCGTC